MAHIEGTGGSTPITQVEPTPRQDPQTQTAAPVQHSDPASPAADARAAAIRQSFEERQRTLDVLERDFLVFDTAKQDDPGEADGEISREDLETVAGGGEYNGGRYTQEQIDAAQYLLDNDGLFTTLDVANQGGGLYMADGVISDSDLAVVRQQQPLFAETGTFHSDHSVLSADVTPNSGPDATPEEAAAQVENVRQFSTGNADASATSQFMAFVRDHQNDPAWLQSYFRALGAEQTAHLLNNVANPSRYNDLSAEYANGEIAAIRDALEGMYSSGELTDADIARLVEHWATERGDLNTGLPQLFAGLEGSGAEGMQNAFFRAAAELSLAGDGAVENGRFTFSEEAIGRLSDGDRQSLAAAAAYVLGDTRTENQVSQLIALQTDGGDAALDRFITQAMAQPTRVAGFDAYTSDAEQERMLDPTLPPPGQDVEYDGVAQIVQSLSWDSTYRGGPDRYLPPAPYTFGELQAVRDQVFYSAANGLDANPGEWEENTTLKDGLARIFMADFDRMVETSVTSNGARLDDESPFPEALENFTQHVLFTEPSGTARDRASEFLIDRLSTTITDINTLSDAEFQQQYGRDQTQQAHLTGEILGHVSNGMEQAIQQAADKRAAQRQGLEFGINLAWALGQDGLKLLPGGNVLSAILPDQITSSQAYGVLKGELESMIKDGLVDQAADTLLEEFPDFHPDETLSGLSRELSEEVRAENGADYLSSFLSSYNNTNAEPADPGD